MNGRPGRLEACDPREETSYPTQLPLHLLLSHSYSYTYYRHKDSIRHWLDHSATLSLLPCLLRPSHSSPQMLLNGECTFPFLFLRFKSDVGSKGEKEGRTEGGILPRSGWRDAV